MPERDPNSLAAREVIDAVTAAHVAGKVSKEAVAWAFDRAFEQFRAEARSMAEDQIRRELGA